MGATTTVRHVANGDEYEKKNTLLVRVASRMFNEVADRARELAVLGSSQSGTAPHKAYMQRVQ
jgi:hypothetical protein